MDAGMSRRRAARRALLQISEEEKKLRQAALKRKNTRWKEDLEKRIPSKAYEGLVGTFSAGFSLVFRQGRSLIEMTYDKRSLQEQHDSRNKAPRGLKQMQQSINRRNGLNMTATTAEGIALGLLGVGLPDIVLFLSTLLKGVYETALHYGFEYASAQEQYLILAMMRAALATGTDWEKTDREVESLLSELTSVSEGMLKDSIHKTASAFAVDMLLLKFIQGMPLVGFLGGAANPVYYNKVMRYIQLKYKKRYLLKQLKEANL